MRDVSLRPTTDRWPLVLLILGALMLLATAFYPFGYDQAAFAVAGEMVRKLGSVPYRDFLDTKPAVIFYLYSLSSALFGHHEWSIRIFDLIYQTAAGAYLFAILRRFLPKGSAIASVGLYLILYSSTGYWMTAQAEGFAVLPSLLLLDMTLRVTADERPALLRGVLAGLALAVLFLLKFTLILGGAAVLVFLMLQDSVSLRRRILYLAALTVTFIALVLGYAAVLSASGGLERFFAALTWVAKYSSIDPLLARNTIGLKYYEEFPGRLLSTCSPVIVALTLWIMMKRAFLRDERPSRPERSLITLLSLSVAAHLFGVVIERKMFPYHYSRVFFAMSPLAALGFEGLRYRLSELWVRIRSARSLERTTSIALFIVGIGVIIFYSPAVKLASQSIPWMLDELRGRDIHAAVQQRTPEYFAKDQTDVERYVTQVNAKNIFVWGNDVGIYFFANRLPTTFCLTATPFRTDWTPSDWRTTLVSQLNTTKPDLFIAEFGDAKSFITGSDDDSYMALMHWPELGQFVSEQYQPDTTIGHFYIYRRRS